jgi:hypothetical protein
MVIGKKKKEDDLSVIILNKIFHKEMGKYSLSLWGKGFDLEIVDDDALDGKDVDNVLGMFVDLYLGSLYLKAKRLIVFRMAIISITILDTNMI